MATSDGFVIAATDTWSARVRLPDGSREHLDTFGYRLAVGAQVAATVDPQHQVSARLGLPSGTPGSRMEDTLARRASRSYSWLWAASAPPPLSPWSSPQQRAPTADDRQWCGSLSGMRRPVSCLAHTTAGCVRRVQRHADFDAGAEGRFGLPQGANISASRERGSGEFRRTVVT
ncbi:hypothetical protein AB0C97_30745 [Streptomyces goshikiensis]|uniref:hypothetical protein n=1 Tax=Streptomyces goshikiensis TaxID=1942 RepID=UPI00340F6AE0